MKALDQTPRIALFVSFSGVGGVERMMVNLASGLIAQGCRVDLLPVKRNSPFLDQIPRDVRVVDLGTRHARTSFPALVRYLRRERPAAMLSAKDRANQIAILANRYAQVPTRIAVRLGTTVSAFLRNTNPSYLRLKTLPIRWIYPQADAVVAVSNGVAEDLKRVAGLPPALVHVVPNPVITPGLAEMASEPVPHPWFNDASQPVIVSMGRLTRQKDFSTLIRAFALVRKRIPSRLVILGEGSGRSELAAWIHRLELDPVVDLPGFAPNPYAYLKRADCFVLSSIWEGSPNALSEALALGKPSVATDCPSGPAEILTGALRPFLVPMRSAEPMAEAIRKALNDPPAPSVLRAAVRDYTVEASSRRYLDVLLGEGQ